MYSLSHLVFTVSLRPYVSISIDETEALEVLSCPDLSRVKCTEGRDLRNNPDLWIWSTIGSIKVKRNISVFLRTCVFGVLPHRMKLKFKTEVIEKTYVSGRDGAVKNSWEIRIMCEYLTHFTKAVHVQQIKLHSGGSMFTIIQTTDNKKYCSVIYYGTL